MDRRNFIYILGGLASLSGSEGLEAAVSQVAAWPGGKKLVGMYIHQHWPYNHPYAARTWTIEDYRGYADGMKKLGYNMLVIWPVLETMPNPLTASAVSDDTWFLQVRDNADHLRGCCIQVQPGWDDAGLFDLLRRDQFRRRIRDSGGR